VTVAVAEGLGVGGPVPVAVPDGVSDGVVGVPVAVPVPGGVFDGVGGVEVGVGVVGTGVAETVDVAVAVAPGPPAK
jgi:hypothetical protein